ncbi:MAG TPA: L,D-transpeptidase [Candidatus Saccharimonadales bacterium]
MGRQVKSSAHRNKDAVLSKAQLHAAAVSLAAMADAIPKSVTALEIGPAAPAPQSRDFTPPADHAPASRGPSGHLLDFAHRYSVAVFALLLLAVGAAGIVVGGDYWSSHELSRSRPITAARPAKPTIAGLNLTVPASKLQTQLQTITNQPATITVGAQAVPVGADTIRSWLQITSNKDKSEYYIRLKAGTIDSSLTQIANTFVKAPVNQVTVSANGVSHVVVGGRDGTSLSDPGTLKTQADQVAKTVMDAKGLQFNTPMQTAPFQSTTPANFDKIIVADITTKQMGAYQGGQMVNSWLVSAGKPSTPTPIGEFHVYAKFTVQDMRGSNPNGTPYFQPQVPWVNYFYEGSAIHGVYWHPLSWFGAINSSHGCVGLPVDEAKWVFDWAPIGTTVIVTDDPALNFVSA